MDSFLEAGQEIAREAGALLAAYYERRIGYDYKSDYDLVTEADTGSERLIAGMIARPPGVSMGAPGSRKSRCMSITRTAVRVGSRAGSAISSSTRRNSAAPGSRR